MRRHQSSRMKARAAKILDLWRPPGVKRTTTQAAIGRAAAMHCTHICGMCHYEKKFAIPRIKSGESIRIVSF
jgi:hypothetical protein